MMSIRTLRFALSLALALVAVIAGPTRAGDLNPPAGAVTATMKPLNQIEPRTAINATNTPSFGSAQFAIQQPGSYYLTENVTGVSGQFGILVGADDVTIDLNGFELTGVPGTLSGIYVDPGIRCVIRNGSLRNWGANGIYGLRAGCVVEDVGVIGCGANGMYLGNDGRATRCMAELNSGHGITVANGCLIDHCVANQNGVGFGKDGINAGDRCLVTDCVANQNGAAGISVNHGGRVVDCQASQNVNGITTYSTGLVSGCLAHLNTADGIRAGQRTTVRDCESAGNADDGIQTEEHCVIQRNTCQSNGPLASGAGIYVPADSCQIEDNRLNSNRYGILVPGTTLKNFIVRNAARSNTTNYSISGANDVAPIITNPGTTFTGATPWSNFAY
jgi:hypothetical protein